MLRMSPNVGAARRIIHISRLKLQPALALQSG